MKDHCSAKLNHTASSAIQSFPYSRKFHRGLIIIMMSFSLTVVVADSMSAPETEVRKIEEVNACDLTERHQMFCMCDTSDSSDESHVSSANCWVHDSGKEKNEQWIAIGNLNNLVRLEFNNRPTRALKYFPPSYMFQGLKKLTDFTIKMAAFEEVPSYAFANSSAIHEISMNDNEIKRLSFAAFANMKSVYKISLDSNFITEVNRGVFSNLPNLKRLFLSRNGMGIVHDYAFKDLRNLEDLDLQFNKLAVIAREVFSGLDKLIRLELQDNRIEFLGDHVFADMPSLQELDLHGNQIRSVSPSAFAGVKKLKRLNMKENKIVTLQTQTFIHMQHIYMMDLRNNEFETLSEKLIEPIYTNLKNVSMQLMIEGNRLMCDCRILWIQKLFKETESPYLKEQLTKIQCDLFHTPEQKLKEVAVSYSSNVTVVAAPPEETTTYAFDSRKNVMELNPDDFKCHEQQDDQKDSSVVYPESHNDDASKGVGNSLQSSLNDDGTIPQKSQAVFESKKDSQQSHHQSHTDISHQSDQSSKVVATGPTGSAESGGSSSLRITNPTQYLSSWISIILSISMCCLLRHGQDC